MTAIGRERLVNRGRLRGVTRGGVAVSDALVLEREHAASARGA